MNEITPAQAIDEANKLGLDDMIGVGPDGNFDINLVPENIRAQVIEMSKGMVQDSKTKYNKEINKRKKKPKAKVKKTFGQNKKKRKK
jgi:hypothetical protein